jgi:hypothetical protein
MTIGEAWTNHLQPVDVTLRVASMMTSSVCFSCMRIVRLLCVCVCVCVCIYRSGPRRSWRNCQRSTIYIYIYIYGASLTFPDISVSSCVYI